ncbi:hypothetical protein [Streptomyces sp. NBC_00063]|uniref:hypothetical protein n=1 Tax=Streptomyces sp. NBC_00063 TaxID=2975638 RepID=UPI003D73F338
MASIARRGRMITALPAPPPRAVLRRPRLLVRPDTISRRHRHPLRRRHARPSRNKHPARLRTVHSTRALVLCLAREDSTWGYRRIHSELATLGIKVAAPTIWKILRHQGIAPAPQRTTVTRTALLHSQADVLLVVDFIETDFIETITLTGQRPYILAVIEHTTHRIRIRILDATAHPTAD